MATPQWGPQEILKDFIEIPYEQLRKREATPRGGRAAQDSLQKDVKKSPGFRGHSL